MKEKILLVTSIAPRNIESQIEALNSWKTCGFEIISCNIKEEIDIVKKYFPNIDFFELNRDSRKINGKPCPYIYDMLKVLQKSKYEIVGIINSDLHLKFFSMEMYSFIHHHAKENVVFIRRQEVNSLDRIDSINTELFFGGIDVFIFSKNILSKIQDDGLILGQAMWDYWFPIVADLKNIPIKELINPIVYHVTHPTRWDDSLTHNISKKICENYFPEVEKNEYISFLKNKFFSIISSPKNQICFLEDNLLEKRVVVNIPYTNEDIENSLKKIWRNIKVINNSTELVQDISYDYSIYIPYLTILSNAFIHLLVWIFEHKKASKIKIPVYFRGRKTGIAHIENCNTKRVHQFNRNIEPIVATKTSCTKSNRKNILWASSFIATISVEDDESVIWAKEGNRIFGNIMIAPAGYMARQWVERYKGLAKNINIKGWIDNNEQLSNSTIQGLKVYKPQDVIVNFNDIDKILVVSNLYEEEIVDQLKNYFNKVDIVIWNEYDAQKWKKNQELDARCKKS